MTLFISKLIYNNRKRLHRRIIEMERWANKVAVVTGASRGIGQTIAEALIENGLKVVGIARNVDSMEEVSGKFYAVKADVRKEEDVVKAFAWILNTLGPVHVLVNNAGVFSMNRLLDGMSEKWKEVFDTNVFGLCVVTREAVQQMKNHGIDGHIIHINSVAGHRVITKPPVNVYPASKHAVTALTETLRCELTAINSKIKITSISPGRTITEASQPTNIPFLEKTDVSDAVCYVLGTPPHVQIHELIIQPILSVFS